MYGETIRQIRLKKASPKRSLWHDYFKIYAIEFEKGKHQIAANLLLQILENLSMDIDEFLYIANGYRLDEQTATTIGTHNIQTSTISTSYNFYYRSCSKPLAD